MKLEAYWYRPKLHPFLLPLLPFSLLFWLASRFRFWCYRLGFIKSQSFDIPVVIIGNISAGGTGKTPLVAYLAKELKAKGKNPGIALRGAGGQKQKNPCFVKPDSNPFEVGDEAVLLAKTTECPVAVCINRPAAVQALQTAGCDLVLCDDGLQHYSLNRTLEIAVVDGQRQFGNGWLLPAGPLREPLSRLASVDFRVTNEPLDLDNEGNTSHFQMQLKPQTLKSVHQEQETLALRTFSGKKVHAVAGLGNPQRFFDLLQQLGMELIPHAYPDHHHFKLEDLHFPDAHPIIMTEKDAIKCQTLAFSESSKMKQWFLKTTTEVSPGFKQALLSKLL